MFVYTAKLLYEVEVTVKQVIDTLAIVRFVIAALIMHVYVYIHTYIYT